MSAAQRKFVGEIAALIDKTVTVITMDAKNYTGTLAGIDPETLSLCLSEAKDDKGTTLHRIVLNGNVVAQILTTEKPFDLKALSERIKRAGFENMVRLYEDKGFIWVMDKIKVTEKGVVEGPEGPLKERIQKVYDIFVKETEAK